MCLPLDTARLWVSPPAMPGFGFLSASPAALSSLGKLGFYAEGGWRDGFVTGPVGAGFRIPDAGTIWLEAGGSFACSAEKDHIIRDDSAEVDRITQRTTLRFYSARLAFCQSRGPFSYAVEVLGALGQLSDEFSSATGTIFPDDIVVSSSPLAYGGGAGLLLDAGLVSVGLHGRYWSDFLRAGRDFQGDSLNSFVLRETAIPDSLEEAFPIEIGLNVASRPFGISGEFLYKGQIGGLASYERAFGPVSARLAGGWMGDPMFLGDATASFGNLGIGFRGGYWGGLRAGGFVFYRI